MIVTEKDAAKVKTRRYAGAVLTEEIAGRVSDGERRSITRILGGDRNWLVVSRAAYLWAKAEFTKVTGQQSVECDFRDPFREEETGKFRRLQEVFPPKGERTEVHVGSVALGLTNPHAHGVDYHAVPEAVVFFRGFSDLNINDANMLRALRDGAKLSAIIDFVGPDEIPMDPTYSSSLMLSWSDGTSTFRNMTKERREALTRMARDLGREMVDSRVFQINVHGPSQSGKTTVAGVLDQSINDIGRFRESREKQPWERLRGAHSKLFMVLSGTLEEVEEEQVSRDKVLIVDEATRCTPDVIMRLRETYPRLVLLTHQPLPGFPEETGIDLASDRIPK